MPQFPSAEKPLALQFADPFVDHLPTLARLDGQAVPTTAARIIEVGEVTAGIAVPEPGGVRFFSSSRDFDPLDGAVFRSVEQAAKAARERLRRRGGPRARHGLRHEAGRRLVAV
ncbi:hypothetical protein [Methylobacterium nigriterrae]|uniref:hypothetical protein n=1 Tax=Methylobacterium nigriterrae TaxID=3127512 RepID=UPI003013FB6E